MAVLLVLPITKGFAVGPCSADEITYTEARVVQEINKIRAEAGVPLLTRLGALDSYAREWSGEQANEGYFFHRDWDGMQTAIPGVTNMNENVLMWRIDYMGSLEDFVREGVGWWENSPVHYRNMTNPDCNVAGLGIVERGGTFYVTLNVGYAAEVIAEQPEIIEEPENLEELEITEEAERSMELEAEDRNGKVWKVAAPDSAPDALNGAVKMELRPSGRGYKIALLNKDGMEISSKGYLDVFFPLEEGQKISNVTIGGVTWTDRLYTDDGKYFILRIEIANKRSDKELMKQDIKSCF